jgi:hypothetical protein
MLVSFSAVSWIILGNLMGFSCGGNFRREKEAAFKAVLVLLTGFTSVTMAG